MYIILVFIYTHHNTKPLLLDAVLIPEVEEPPTTFNYSRRLLEAQKERDIALLVARKWRDIPENIQDEKQDMKTEMERTVKTVRNFWRNKVIEGSSRSGKMLGAALRCQVFVDSKYNYIYIIILL